MAARTKKINDVSEIIPMLKSVELMSKLSGIGERKLRDMMDNNEIEYVENGNRRLLADQSIWDWYERNRVVATKYEKEKYHGN